MPTFRRKSDPTIQATQWFKNGDHPDDYRDSRQEIVDGVLCTVPGAEAKKRGWEGQVVRYFRDPRTPGHMACECGKTMNEHGWIDQPVSSPTVCPGDWIFTGTGGRYHVAHPDVFDRNYEKIGD